MIAAVRHLIVCLLLLAMVGCEKPPVPVNEPVGISVDGNKAFTLLEEICAIGPRPSGSDGAKKTVDYITAKCEAMGYKPVVTEWTEDTPTGEITFRNVSAELKGSGSGFVILGTHFDTKDIDTDPPFIGANDSGSSTAQTRPSRASRHRAR